MISRPSIQNLALRNASLLLPNLFWCQIPFSGRHFCSESVTISCISSLSSSSPFTMAYDSKVRCRIISNCATKEIKSGVILHVHHFLHHSTYIYRCWWIFKWTWTIIVFVMEQWNITVPALAGTLIEVWLWNFQKIAPCRDRKSKDKTDSVSGE